jgi:hypothetical protein
VKQTFLLLAFVTALAGCGGGSAGSINAVPGGKETVSGPFISRSLTPGRVFSLSGTNTVIAGLHSASYDLVRLQLPPITTLSSTEANNASLIALDKGGRPAIFDVGRAEIIDGRNLANAVYSNSGTPDVGPLYDRITWTSYMTADGQFPYQASVDGTSSFALSPTQMRFVRYSPDGARMAAIVNNQVAILNSSGSGLTPITSDATSITSLTWSPDGTRILYGTNRGEIKSIPYGGGTPLVLMTSASSSFIRAISFYTTSNWTALRSDNLIIQGNLASWTFATNILPGTSFFSYSPDGRQMAVTNSEGTFIKPNGQFDVVGTQIADTSYNSAEWAPYMEKRNFVGASGGYGTSCAGFMYSINRKSVSAFVTAESTVPGSVTFERGDNSNPGQDSLMVTVLAPGGLSGLKFQNRLYGARIAAVTSSLGAEGAFVLFDAFDGAVNFVIPFSGTLSKSGPGGNGDREKSYRGRFLAVINGEGKNLAPSGAKSISISQDEKSVQIH